MEYTIKSQVVTVSLFDLAVMAEGQLKNGKVTHAEWTMYVEGILDSLEVCDKWNELTEHKVKELLSDYPSKHDKYSD